MCGLFDLLQVHTGDITHIYTNSSMPFDSINPSMCQKRSRHKM